MILSRSKNILGLILQEKNIGIRELERLSGVSRTAVSNIVHGKSEPSLKTCQKIADALNVNVDDIFGLSHYYNNTLEDSSFNKNISYLSKKHIYAIKLYENLSSYTSLQKQDYQLFKLDSFALKQAGYNAQENINESIIAIAMKDSSMQPSIRKNELLFIDTSAKEIEDSKIYVLEYENTTMVRKLYKEQNSLRAKTFDSNIGMLIENIEDVHIFGRVVFIKPSPNLLLV